MLNLTQFAVNCLPQTIVTQVCVVHYVLILLLVKWENIYISFFLVYFQLNIAFKWFANQCSCYLFMENPIFFFFKKRVFFLFKIHTFNNSNFILSVCLVESFLPAHGVEPNIHFLLNVFIFWVLNWNHSRLIKQKEKRKTVTRMRNCIMRNKQEKKKALWVKVN